MIQALHDDNDDRHQAAAAAARAQLAKATAVYWKLVDDMANGQTGDTTPNAINSILAAAHKVPEHFKDDVGYVVDSIRLAAKIERSQAIADEGPAVEAEIKMIDAKIAGLEVDKQAATVHLNSCRNHAKFGEDARKDLAAVQATLASRKAG
jgi:hypothetical protein